ncbi:MAG: phosphatidylglycerophosphatase A [Spirochaetales bacterium]|nr:phosphatidylglycerophosphatase A [Leptospiraceae bacterium]MCP5481760.1 phosphatidylglycerophosphatase A [Spirochaetales bacterium]
MKYAVARFFATGFYSGLIPGAPGTYGTIVAVPLVYLAAFLPLPGRVAITLAIIVGGVWCTEVVLRKTGEKDPGYVVIDEIAGLFLAMIFFEVTPLRLLIAFVAFRVFDILKPPPVHQLDQLGGSWGVMLDDLGAGLYAALVLGAAIFLVARYMPAYAF